jgi:isovaleryl-CoA dehydrogenase
MFNGPDLQLTEMQQMLREAVYQFSQTEIAPLAEKIDKNNTFPRDLWPKMGELGLHGITVKEAHGGTDMGYLAHVIAMEEISRASASVGLSYGAHSNLCINQLARFGTDDQLKQFLPPLIRGEHVGALAMSEAGSGSDVMSMRCHANDTGSHFILNGTKMWITNGTLANILIVYAKTDPTKGKHGISTFIIKNDMPGFKTAGKLDKLGMRGSDTCELIFENCPVPHSHLLGELNGGLPILMSGLDYERTILAAGPLGIMQACLDIVLPYVTERKQFGKAIGEFQMIQSKVANMYTQLNASRALLYSVARACDNQTCTSKDAAAAILFCAENATQIALDAIQILGGNGYINEYPTGRLLRDAKLYEIGAGTSEIRRLIIARELFKDYL